MAKEEEKNVKGSKEDLHKRLESKVLGLLEETEVKEDKPEKKATKPPDQKKKEPPTLEKPPENKEKRPPEEPKPKEPEAAAETKDEEQQKTEAPKTVEPEKPAEPKEAQKKSEKKDEEAKPAESLDELLAQREEIEALLSSIEDSYRDATLPDKTYHEVKNKNEKKLDEINKKLGELQKTAGPEELRKIEESRAAAEKAGPAPAAKEEAEEKAEEGPEEARPEPEATEKPSGVKLTAEQKGRIDPVIKLLEAKIEEKLRNVIDTANVEITDKRLKKLEGRLDVIERAAKDIKATSDTTSKTVGGYDKQLTVMKTEVEKVKALVDAVKEAKNIMDEKLQRTTETFAEIRSIVYQREARAKEEEVLLDKLKDTVSQVDTARILREFTTRDEQLRDVNSRLERLERSGKMLTDSINKIKGLMTDIGSLENIVKASKHVGEKLEKIQEIEERMKASSSKLDSVYVDMKKKLDEFTEYKVKQDKLSGMMDDVMKNVEDFARRLSDYATKDDITQIKDELNIVRESAKKSQAAQVPPEVAGLNEEKEQIETLLATLEENYKNKEIGEEEYQKAKESNMLKLAQIQKNVEAASSGKKQSGGGGASSGGEESKHTRVMMLAKLREAYENGELSRAAYEKSRRLLLKKG